MALSVCLFVPPVHPSVCNFVFRINLTGFKDFRNILVTCIMSRHYVAKKNGNSDLLNFKIICLCKQYIPISHNKSRFDRIFMIIFCWSKLCVANKNCNSSLLNTCIICSCSTLAVSNVYAVSPRDNAVTKCPERFRIRRYLASLICMKEIDFCYSKSTLCVKYLG